MLGNFDATQNGLKPLQDDDTVNRVFLRLRGSKKGLPGIKSANRRTFASRLLMNWLQMATSEITNDEDMSRQCWSLANPGNLKEILDASFRLWSINEVAENNVASSMKTSDKFEHKFHLIYFIFSLLACTKLVYIRFQMQK